MSLINQMLRDLESRNPANKPSSILHDNIKVAEAPGSKTPIIIGMSVVLIVAAGGGYWAYEKTQAEDPPTVVAENIKKDIAPIAPYEDVMDAQCRQTNQRTKGNGNQSPVVRAAPVVQPSQPVKVGVVVVLCHRKKMPVTPKPAQSKRVSSKQQADLLFHQVENNFEGYLAVPKLEQVLKLDPRHLKARLLLAKTLHNQGQVDKTADFLDQSLALFPDNLQFINTRAQIFLQQKNPNGALKTLQHVELANSSNEAYLSLLAASYQQQQSFSNAASIYQRLVAVNPDKAESWLGLALSHEKLGNAKLAREAYQQALGKNTLKPSVADSIKQRLIELR
jgi:Tfp pilus assembly protein PilF